MCEVICSHTKARRCIRKFDSGPQDLSDVLLWSVRYSSFTLSPTLQSPVYRCQNVNYSCTIEVDLQLASPPYYQRNTDTPEYHNPKRYRTSPIVPQGLSPAIFCLGKWKAISTLCVRPKNFPGFVVRATEIYLCRGTKGQRERGKGKGKRGKGSTFHT